MKYTVYWIFGYVEKCRNNDIFHILLKKRKEKNRLIMFLTFWLYKRLY